MPEEGLGEPWDEVCGGNCRRGSLRRDMVMRLLLLLSAVWQGLSRRLPDAARQARQILRRQSSNGASRRTRCDGMRSVRAGDLAARRMDECNLVAAVDRGG